MAEFQHRQNLPANLENKTHLPPLIPEVAEPATVDHPEREPHYLNLAEAIALALEQGTTGLLSTGVTGAPTEDLTSFTGVGVAQTDSVRVLALQPAIAGATIEAALARFDAFWSTGLNWTTTDEPTQGLSSFTNGQAGQFRTTLAKPLPTGGYAGLTFSTDYRMLASPPTGPFSVLNPSYTPRLQVGFEQPLLKNFGVDINQVIPAFPFSALFPELNSRRTTSEGILLTRLRFDQQRAEFERNINFLLLNVEVAYWNLYSAYFTLYSNEEGLRQAREAWRIEKNKLGAGTITPHKFAQIEEQYEFFRANRILAIGKVLESERSLRVLLGLPVEDGKRLIPIDAPTLAPFQADWKLALHEALNLRPELVLARDEVRAKQLNLAAQQNSLRPDLRFQATYTAVGLGSRLDGDGTFLSAAGIPFTNNALQSLSTDHFNNWTMGFVLSMPIGFRQEHAAVRQARLELAKSYYFLKDQELKAQNFLAKQFSKVVENYKVAESRHLRRKQLAKVLKGLFDYYRQGLITPADRTYVRMSIGPKGEPIPVVTDLGKSLIEAQRDWAAALAAEYQAIVDYNNALARFEFARGTIMQHNNVMIAEGQLPACAQVRAVEHERQRARALVLGHRSPPPDCAEELPTLGLHFGPQADSKKPSHPVFEKLPILPGFEKPPPLPALWNEAPPFDPGDPLAEEEKKTPVLPQPRMLPVDLIPPVPAPAHRPSAQGPAPALSSLPSGIHLREPVSIQTPALR